MTIHWGRAHELNSEKNAALVEVYKDKLRQACLQETRIRT